MRYWLYGIKDQSKIFSLRSGLGGMLTKMLTPGQVYISALRKYLAHIPGLGKNSLPTWIFTLTNPNVYNFS